MDVELVKLVGSLDVAVGWRNLLLMVRRRSVGWVRGWTLGRMLEVCMTVHLRSKANFLLALTKVLAVFAVGVKALMEWLQGMVEDLVRRVLLKLLLVLRVVWIALL